MKDTTGSLDIAPALQYNVVVYGDCVLLRYVTQRGRLRTAILCYLAGKVAQWRSEGTAIDIGELIEENGGRFLKIPI